MAQSGYDVVFNQIIELMQKGEIPWKKNWKMATPRNGKSGHRYGGINFFILSASGYADQRWFTFKQIKELGGNVKRGEKARQIVFWSMYQVPDGDKTKSVPVLRYFSVFNYEQAEGLKVAVVEPKGIIEAEEVINSFSDKPTTLYGFSHARYIPSKDEVEMPSREQFGSTNEFYATLYHEYAHSCAHESRLNQKLDTKFGSTEYSAEELVAELTSAFLCNHSGIDNTLENSAAYLKGWMKALENDPKMLIQAASKAQKRADYILGVRPTEASETATEG